MKTIFLRLCSFFQKGQKKKQALQQLDHAWQHAYNKTRHLDHYRNTIEEHLKTKQQLDRAIFHLFRNGK